MHHKDKTIVITRQDAELIRQVVRHISTSNADIQNLALEIDRFLTERIQKP